MFSYSIPLELRKMTERKARGSVINGYLKYIKKTWGQDGVDQCAGYLGIDPKDIKDGNWYSDEYGDKLLEWMVSLKGKKYVVLSNRYMVKDLGMLAYIVRFMDVKTILKKLPKNYDDIFNFGRVEVDIKEKNAVVRVYDAATSEHSCPGWQGVFEGAFELTKTKGGRVKETMCQWKGDEYCVWELSWE